MSVVEQLPGVLALGDGLFRLPRQPVDVYIRQLGGQCMVYSAICDLAGAKNAVYSYLLQRNASRKVMPGAFALYDGQVIVCMLVEPHDLSAACQHILATATFYAPKILPML